MKTSKKSVGESTVLETDFPIEIVSEACAREKSVRRGHISTLQQWWARRPLAVCRAALFASQCPSSATIADSPTLRRYLDTLVPPDKRMAPVDLVNDQIDRLFRQLVAWPPNNDFISRCGEFVRLGHRRRPTVADTFAGGGSFPIEALRLGMNAYASDLNPVATAALRLALELAPQSSSLMHSFRQLTEQLCARTDAEAARWYAPHGEPGEVLALFWARTVSCVSCAALVPLMKSFWLARRKRDGVAVRLTISGRAARFEIWSPKTADEHSTADAGTMTARGAKCPNCGAHMPFADLRRIGAERRIGEVLYAKLLQDSKRKRHYVACAPDETVAAIDVMSQMEQQFGRAPGIPLDANGIRHTWAMQYGVTSTADLYNLRQGAALSWLVRECQQHTSKCTTAEDRRLLSLLCALTVNRLVPYQTRHTWWQSDGEFPANMFGRQAIPMVWDYVEIPINSIGAAGLKSAVKWLHEVVEHVVALPRRAQVHTGDASQPVLDRASVDLIAIDPPYYDSVTYGYLADVFYPWMRLLLKEEWPAEYVGERTDKSREAIVDRKHKLAPTPKTGTDFTRTMYEALTEARRIVRPDGHLLLMYGHKSIEAWAALAEALLRAGWIPTVSWPVHTERKVKFRHGHIDALSSSCLILCSPAKARATKSEVHWAIFEEQLFNLLSHRVTRFGRARIFGNDLLTALLAPALGLFASYRVVDDVGPVSVATLFRELPRIVRSASEGSTKRSPANKEECASAALLVARLNGAGDFFRESGRDLGNPTVKKAGQYAELLWKRELVQADRVWQRLSAADRTHFVNVVRRASIFAEIGSRAHQLVNASLGRVSMALRKTEAIDYAR